MNICISAYLDNNIGDDLMIITLVKNFQDHNFFIFSDRSIVREKFKDYDNIYIYNENEFESKLKDLSIYLTIGGSLFNNLNSIMGKLFRLKRIRLLKKLKKEKIYVATMGVNFPIIEHKIGKKILESEMKINDLITVRDDYSYKLISHLNLKSCFLIDDFVYNIAKTPYILENVEKVNSNNEKYILGISAYRSPIKGDSNIASYRVLADICDNVIEKRGAKVKLFSFDSENENDLVSAFYIKKYAKHANEIEIVPYLNDEINFLNNFVSCDRIIGIRFHSLIISDVYGIPFYPISYSNKTNNFLTDIGYKGNINNYSDLEINKQRILSDILSDTFFISNKSNNSEQHLLEFENLIRKIETNRVVNNCE